jgi:hypothetical protein
MKLITCVQERTSTEALRAEDCVTILVCQPAEVTIQLHFCSARRFAVCRQFNMSKYSIDVVKVIPHIVMLYGARTPRRCFISYDDIYNLIGLKIKKHRSTLFPFMNDSNSCLQISNTYCYKYVILAFMSFLQSLLQVHYTHCYEHSYR